MMKNKTNNAFNEKTKSAYDDGNIPAIDLPQSENIHAPVEPLPESTRPRKDGPGGDTGE